VSFLWSGMKTNDMKLSILALVIFFFSCGKDRSCENCYSDDATVLNSGLVAADGCGWVIKIDSDQYYHPDVLSAEFMQNNLPVKISYELTSDKFFCGIAGTGLPVIHLVKIEK